MATSSLQSPSTTPMAPPAHPTAPPAPAAAPSGWRSSNGVPDDPHEPSPSNGVTRASSWLRHRRLSTWHRPYAAVLVVLDLIAVGLASLTATSQTQQGDQWFPRPARSLPADRVRAASRSAGSSCCGRTAPTTAATSASAPTSSSGSSGPRSRSRPPSPSSPSPPRPTCSRLSVGSPSSAPWSTSCVLRFIARRVLHCVRGRGRRRATGCCWSAPCPRRSRSTPRSPGPGRRAGPGRHPPHRGLRGRAAAPDPGAGLRRPRRARAGPRARRRHDRGLRLGQRRAAASCAGSPGSSRAPASTWSSRRS